jgi:HK97 family phage portal protein
MLNFRAAWRALTGGAKVRSASDGDDDDWLLSPDTPSGVKLTRKKAYSVSSWFRAINLLSAAVAKTRIQVLDKRNGGNTPDPAHPISKLLTGHGKPNDETLRFHFIQTLTAHAIGHGGGYAYIYRDEGGRPIEFLQLRPDRTYPVRENGRLLFVTSIGGDYGAASAQTIKLLAENVLHIHGLGYDGLTGYSLLSLASRSLGSAVAKEEFGARYFKNSASPSVIIKTPKKLTPQAFNNLQRSWSSLRTGLDNAHKTAILEEGAEVQQFSHNAADAQLIQAMDRDPVMVSNFTGVPPHLLGVQGYNSYNSLEISSQDLLDYALDPWFYPWEQELADKCLTEQEKRSASRTVEFRRADLIRVDHAKRIAGNRVALGGHPYKTVNQVRVEEGDQPVEGYDFIPVPLNMSSTPDNTDPEKEDPTPDDPTPAPTEQNEEAARAVRQLVEQTAKRMVSRLHGAAERKGVIPADHRSVLVEAFGPLMTVARSNVTAEAVADELLRSVEKAVKESRLSEFLETTPAAVTEAICGKQL